MERTLKQIALGDVERELFSTRQILERLPDARWSWRPHEKSRPLGPLAVHVGIETVRMMTLIVTQPELDFGRTRPRSEPVGGLEALLPAFDAGRNELLEALDALTDEHLLGTWTMRSGDHMIMKAPRLVALRTAGVSHHVHHRGQLSVYLRLLDVPVPGMYGPSADEQ